MPKKPTIQPSIIRPRIHELLVAFARRPDRIDYERLSRDCGPFGARLVRCVLANLTYLDARLGALTAKALHKTEPTALAALRLGAAELLLLGTKAHAAVHENVDAMQKRQPHLRGFVNGVLRSLERQQAAGNAKEPQDPSVRYSHPRWLWNLYVEAFGAETAASIAAADNQEQPTVLRNNRRRQAREVLMEKLQSMCEAVSPSIISEDGIVVIGLPALTDPRLAALWDAGDFYFQNDAAQMAAILLSPRSGNKLVDLCSAPGGKATHLAEVINDNGEVLAFESQSAKLGRISENAARLGLRSIRPVQGDVEAGDADTAIAAADGVLLDPPCSGLGILRKTPEGRWLQTPDNIAELAERQFVMLQRTVKAMRPGATGIYSVCTITPQETFGVIDRAKHELPEFRQEALQPTAYPRLAAHLRRGCLLTVPSGETPDGYFIARFSRL